MLGLEPTPLDLTFRLGRIPVRVLPWFWAAAAILGWSPDDPRFMLVTMLCVFVSILIHELGHALIAEAFGWPTEILLYHFGGLAISQRYFGNTPWRSIAVSLAGPFAGFACYGLILLLDSLWTRAHLKFDQEAQQVIWQPILERDYENLIRWAFIQLEYINLWWGIVNLAPVLPLDGGQVCRSFLESLRLRNYETLTHQISIVVGGLIAWYFLSRGDRFAGLLFLFLTLQNFSSFQQSRGRW